MGWLRLSLAEAETEKTPGTECMTSCQNLWNDHEEGGAGM